MTSTAEEMQKKDDIFPLLFAGVVLLLPAFCITDSAFHKRPMLQKAFLELFSNVN